MGVVSDADVADLWASLAPVASIAAGECWCVRWPGATMLTWKGCGAVCVSRLLSNSKKRFTDIDAVRCCWMLLLLLLLPMQARGVWQAWYWSPVAGQLLSLQVRTTTTVQHSVVRVLKTPAVAHVCCPNNPSFRPGHIQVAWHSTAQHSTEQDACLKPMHRGSTSNGCRLCNQLQGVHPHLLGIQFGTCATHATDNPVICLHFPPQAPAVVSCCSWTSACWLTPPAHSAAVQQQQLPTTAAVTQPSLPLQVAAVALQSSCRAVWCGGWRLTARGV
jgi:hypothetical protein